MTYMLRDLRSVVILVSACVESLRVPVFKFTLTFSD